MTRLPDRFRTFCEAVAAAMMAAMFATFILQVTIRYTARVDWVAETLPWIQPSNFGWTLELCLALWVWLVFWGNALIVHEHDHVSFDMLYLAVPRRVRRGFVIIAGLAIAIGLLLSVAPTWERFYVLRLKKSATLSVLFGDWIRMRDIYSIYIFFLLVVAGGYLLRVWRAFRHSVEEPALPELEHVDR